MGETRPVLAHTVLGTVTNGTPVEFEVTSKCDVFITTLSGRVEFLDSWGKVVADSHFVVGDIKPFGRQVFSALVMNLPREKFHRWQVGESRSGKRIFRPLVQVQRVEGSNTLGEVTVEVW